ncbi:MAG: hypothetical protein M1150_04195 [Patescibacteria group bacterium]|nr:hypothetical protein [Patescibacteria group bacterium]
MRKKRVTLFVLIASVAGILLYILKLNKKERAEKEGDTLGTMIRNQPGWINARDVYIDSSGKCWGIPGQRIFNSSLFPGQPKVVRVGDKYLLIIDKPESAKRFQQKEKPDSGYIPLEVKICQNKSEVLSRHVQ